VSRSESLVRHVNTFCFMFCGDDIVIVIVPELTVTVEE
jgi:hypothetical protein